MQKSEEIFFFKNYSLHRTLGLVFCDLISGLGLAAESEKWKKIEFKSERG